MACMVPDRVFNVQLRVTSHACTLHERVRGENPGEAVIQAPDRLAYPRFDWPGRLRL